MDGPQGRTASEWALLAVNVFKVCGAAIGGMVIRGAPGPARDAALAACRDSAGATPWTRIPINVDQDRLLGGLDLAATLAASKPVVSQGLLALADQGTVVLAMAERQAEFVTASLCDVLDTHELRIEREGLAATARAELAVIALDEGRDDDAPLAIGLRERLALTLETDYLPADVPYACADATAPDWQRVTVPVEAYTTLVNIADQLGIDSPRPVLAAINIARVLAAFEHAREASDRHVTEAAVLALLMRMPGGLAALEQTAEQPDAAVDDPHEEPPTPTADPEQDAARDPTDDEPTASDAAAPEKLDEATEALLPLQLLTQLAAAAARQQRTRNAGNSGAQAKANARGRPLASRPGIPAAGARLDLLATLKSAAPWQKLRPARSNARIAVQKDDLRVRRFKAQTRSTTVFIVDASGSAAIQRLAETKGAIELLLAECYVRRDQVALVAFRNDSAEVLLPATRSLVRAKRALAALPGGGGTPLAHGLRAGLELADAIAKRGETPLVVLLTDARANIALDGSANPALADEHALAVGKEFAQRGYQSLLIDAGRRPGRRCQQLADALDARYLPLPFADAGSVSQAVQGMAA
ncbi:MAG: magnesium chelatase subunit D [Pseudomonadota bacterium]